MWRLGKFWGRVWSKDLGEVIEVGLWEGLLGVLLRVFRIFFGGSLVFFGFGYFINVFVIFFFCLLGGFRFRINLKVLD